MEACQRTDEKAQRVCKEVGSQKVYCLTMDLNNPSNRIGQELFNYAGNDFSEVEKNRAQKARY